jgi:GTP pyrophosphokinase
MQLQLDLLRNEEDYWSNILPVLRRNGLDIEKIKICFDFVVRAHKNQKRESGEPYVTHPIWVAKVVAQLGLAIESVEAALLHDCIEDTEITESEVEKLFGDEVSQLVAGLTSVKNIVKEIEIHQTDIEVFRKLLCSSVNDVRILIIKIIDILHNGLTLNHLTDDRKLKYAKRVVGVYGPIAEYIGLHYFKRSIEDIAFRINNPKESERIEKILKKNKKYEIKAMGLVQNEIEQILKINNVNDFEINGRIKSLYSTYLKLKNKGKKVILDRVGIRIICSQIRDCYTILGLLHAKFRHIPEEFNDYISSPKVNGYRSIQTTLLWKNDLTVEIQIRTIEMHEFDEFGPASHIAYKSKNADSDNYGWIKELVKWKSGKNKANNYQINVLIEFIYIFTPKGDVIQMPKGATALDFAYRIHSDVGDKCNGVLINKKMAKIDTQLKTGDLVEIITGKKVNANSNWLRLVKTELAKEAIRKVVRESNVDKI